jgi:stearoyl-CoA desaturase (delta-9 desaturase)
VVSILTLGEGLHNNHHRFPRDASISHAWYEIDITGLIIRGLGKLGLVQDIFEGGAQATRSGNADAGGQRSMAEQEAEG